MRSTSLGAGLASPRAVQVVLAIAIFQVAFYGVLANMNVYRYKALGTFYQFLAFPMGITLLLLPLVAGWQVARNRGRYRLVAAIALLLWAAVAGFILWMMHLLNE